MLPQDDKNEGTSEGTNEGKGNRKVSKKVCRCVCMYHCAGDKGTRDRGEELVRLTAAEGRKCKEAERVSLV